MLSSYMEHKSVRSTCK